MLNYAIIGCGRIFRNHAVSIARHPYARLTAVSDIRPEALEDARAEFDVQTFTDYEEMLKKADIDAVSICLPHHLHEPAAVACARAGKHVLCEKPIALNREQAMRMISACRENDVKLGIVLQNRYNDATRAVLKAVEQGRFGKMIAGSMLLAAYRGPDYYQDAWHGRWATEGGGSLLTQGIHNVELLCMFLGKPVSIQAHTANLIHAIEVEDTCAAFIRFDNGAVGTIATTNNGLREWWHRIDLIGTAGSVTVEDNRIVRWDFADSCLEDSTVGCEQDAGDPIGAADYGIGHPRLIADFIASILEDRPFAVSGEDSLKVSEVIWAAYRSARSGQPEEIPHQ